MELTSKCALFVLFFDLVFLSCSSFIKKLVASTYIRTSKNNVLIWFCVIVLELFVGMCLLAMLMR